MTTMAERPYESPEDLYAIGRLIRRAYAQDACWNAWTFCRFDIWAQRRIADERLLGKSGWQQGIRLWEDQDTLIGAAFPDRRGLAAIIQDGMHPELLDPMLDHLEAQAAGQIEADPLEVEIRARNTCLRERLAERGYQGSEDFMYCRARPLIAAERDPVRVPEGFRLKTLESDAERQGYIYAVQTVFKVLHQLPIQQMVHQAPSARACLDLICVSDEDEIAAFSTAWFDEESRIAEFEPVGTVPQFQKRGLASALLAETCNRLRRLGCREVHVESWSESEGANRLYAASGLKEVDTYRSWSKTPIAP
jgi:ribosomal protein S18 acetylase RimI-like enzyme